MLQHPLKIFNWSVFLQTQIFMLPVILLFYQENGLTLGDYFLFQGIFSITALLFEIPAGYIGDIFPRKNVLLLSYGFFMARLLLWTFWGGYWILLAGEILYSISKASFAGVADGYIYDYLKSKNQTKRMLKYYGQMNFFMSAGTAIASLVGAYFYDYFRGIFGNHTGFIILLLIEIIFNTFAILLLLFLPKVPPVKRQKCGMKEKYVELFQITKTALVDKRINSYMFFSGIAAATTMVFVWSFQPLMTAAALPLSLFGVVYFMNHLCRAGAGFFLQRTILTFSLKGTAVLVYLLYILSFIASIVLIYSHSVWMSLGLLGFICIAIGFQLSFTMGSIGRIHSLVSSAIRSTVSSVNNMISRSMAGLLLISFKFLLDDVSLQTSFLIYMGFFSLGLYPLIKILKTPEMKEDNNFKEGDIYEEI